jgi:hypothetical protein
LIRKSAGTRRLRRPMSNWCGHLLNYNKG